MYWRSRCNPFHRVQSLWITRENRAYGITCPSCLWRDETRAASVADRPNSYPSIDARKVFRPCFRSAVSGTILRPRLRFMRAALLLKPRSRPGFLFSAGCELALDHERQLDRKIGAIDSDAISGLRRLQEAPDSRIPEPALFVLREAEDECPRLVQGHEPRPAID